MFFVGEPGDCTTKGIASTLTAERQQRASILPRIDIGASGFLPHRIVSWRPDDYVRASVMVHIADAGGMSAEFIARVFCPKSETQTTVATRVYFRIAALGGAGDHIGNAISVGVTGRINPCAEFVVSVAVS